MKHAAEPVAQYEYCSCGAVLVDNSRDEVLPRLCKGCAEYQPARVWLLAPKLDREDGEWTCEGVFCHRTGPAKMINGFRTCFRCAIG